MTRPRSILPGMLLLVAALSCNQAEPADRDASPRVVFQSPELANDATARPGRELGPAGGEPEVIVLGEPAPAEPATPRTVPRPDPGPRIIYRTIYVEEPAHTTESGSSTAGPIAGEVVTPVPEPVVAETEPLEVPEPVEPTGPEPVATTTPPTAPTPTFPDGGSSRTEDAVVGAAIGAGIGAIFGGADGALRGGIGGALGGAIGGRSGGVLGGVLGGTSSRGRLPRRGGGCWVDPGQGRSPAVILDDFVLR